MSRATTLTRSEKYGLQAHLTIYFLATVAILLLLFEQFQLATRVHLEPVGWAEILVQQFLLAVFLGLLMVSYGWIENRWLYVSFAILFAGYSGTRLAAAFSETIGLVPSLDQIGVPLSDYQGTFYLLALASAFCYLLTILLLRQS